MRALAPEVLLSSSDAEFSGDSKAQLSAIHMDGRLVYQQVLTNRPIEKS
jgi:hypothetical protein